MMRYLLPIALVSLLCACSQETASDKEPAAPSSTEARTGDDSKALKSQVENLVREFSGDTAAKVTITSQDDTIVCGTAVIYGESKNFYTDLVDGEAFIESGLPAIDAAISAAC